MDSREFAALLPALLGGSALVPESAEAQGAGLPVIESGVSWLMVCSGAPVPGASTQ